MDIENYSKVLSYVVCELTMPVKRHAVNFLANDQRTLNNHLISAAGSAVFTQKVNNKKQQFVNSNHINNIQNKSVTSSSGIEDRLEQSKRDISIDLPQTNHYNFKEHKDLGLTAMSFSNNHSLDTNSEVNDYLIEDEGSESTGFNQMSQESKLEVIDNKIRPSTDTDLNIKNEHAEEIEEDVVEPVEEADENIELDSISNDPMLGAHADPFLQSMESDFKNMFKVTRSTFETLVEFLSKEQMEPVDNIPLYKKLLIVLWLIGNSGSYGDAADIFDVTEEAAANCFFDVCATLFNQCDNIITWPDVDECNEIASRIEKNCGFPGVVGVLGCRYFSVSIPKEAILRREHFNAKEKAYCIALQIVCDDNLMIRDIFPGLPGSVTEEQIFRKSPLCEQLTSESQPYQLVESHKHILARSLYPQLTSLLTPYSGETLSKEECELNELHENVCQLVDQTFEMLQDRFSTLKILDPEVATMVLVVACVIHNFCVSNGDLVGLEN